MYATSCRSAESRAVLLLAFTSNKFIPIDSYLSYHREQSAEPCSSRFSLRYMTSKLSLVSNFRKRITVSGSGSGILGREGDGPDGVRFVCLGPKARSFSSAMHVIRIRLTVDCARASLNTGPCVTNL